MQISKKDEQISTYTKIEFNGPNGFLDQINKIDFYQYLLTLPYIQYKIENKFKRCISFISNDISNNLKWKKKLENLKRPIIAIQWKGNEKFLDDQQRSIPFKFFSNLIKDKNYSFNFKDVILLQSLRSDGIKIDQIDELSQYKSELKWFDGEWSRFKPGLGKDKRGKSGVEKYLHAGS